MTNAFCPKLGNLSLLFAWLSAGIISCAPKPSAVPKNEYGLQVITQKGTYKKMVKADSARRMVPLSAFLDPVITSYHYATPDNFTRQVLYKHPVPYMRLEAALALKQVQDTLHALGLDLMIFDAYRPYSVTKKMWEIVPDDRYAADPANGSGHNRGVSVDLTLIDAKTRMPLPMPTAFDNFTDSAHHDFMALPEDVLRNRALLRQVMERFGFKALDTEWWHYALPDPKRYELLDLEFRKMRKLVR